jgi:hypothetical protein
MTLEGIARAEAQLDALIERRALEAQEANRVEAAWAESVRRYNLKRQAERRQEWREHFLHLAEVHAGLAAENRAKALRLVGAKGDA